MMRRSPAVTAVAMLSLALGIGASTAIFTVFDALLLKPLPVDRPDTLRTTETIARIGAGAAKKSFSLPYEFFQALQRDDSVFSEVLAFTIGNEPVLSDGTRVLPTTGGAIFVSTNYFSMLKVRPQAGRLFQPDDGPESLQAVVLGDRYWRQQFAADPDIVGRSIHVNGTAATIIGVTPSEFFGLTVGRAPDFYMPIVPASPGGAVFGVQIVGRVQPGMTDPEARDRLTAFLQSQQPVAANRPALTVEVLPLETGLSTTRALFGKPLSALMAMVVLLLIVACTNVATILLARGAARRVEISIRSAIGAGRMRLFRQLTTEGAVLVVCGGALGVVLAHWTVDLLLRLLQLVDASLAVNAVLDARVLLFTALACGVAVFVAAVVPAIHALRASSGAVLRERSEPSHSSRRPGGSYVVIQVAVSLTLVAASGLLARTLYSLVTIDAGFNPHRVAVVSVAPGARGYERERLTQYYEDLSVRLRAMPGVEAASMSQFSFLTTARTTGTIDVPGFTPATDDDRWVQVYQVGAQFLGALAIPIVKGHDFTDADLTATPTAIAINTMVARRFFGDENPIGRSIFGDARREYRVIAVVADGRYNTLRDVNGPVIFVPYTARLRERMTYTVRLSPTTGESESAALQRVLAEVRTLDPLVPAPGERLQALIDRSLGQERLLVVIAGFFAAAALLLLALGLYGVIGFWVTARTGEIGIRLALGARRSQVIWDVLRRPAALVLIGTTLGSVMTLAGARLAGSLLFGLSPQDPLTLAAATTFLVAVAALAAIVPARRASRVDPIVALRCD